MNSTQTVSPSATTPDSPLFSRNDSSRTQDTAVTKPSSGVKSSVQVSSKTSSTSSPRHNNHHRRSTGVAPKVVYGSGAIGRLPTELGKLGLSAPLIVSSPSRISLARKVQALIPNLDTHILDSALVSVPQRVVDDAVGRVTDRDSVISVGGASAMRLAKAIALKKCIPHICVPTSYAGSESPLLGDMRRRKSKSHRYRSGSSSASKTSSEDDTQILPEMIIYDEDLTATSSTMTISAPNDDKSADANRLSLDDDSQWSYIHLPGV